MVAHLDSEQLVLLALGDSAAEAGHLAACAACRTEVEPLRAVAELGADTHELRDLPAPPESVWAAIASTVTGGSAAGRPALDQPAPDQPAPGQPAPGQPAPDQPAPDQPARSGPAPARPARSGPTPNGPGPGGPRRILRRHAWARLAATAVAAALVGVVGTLGATRLLERDPGPNPRPVVAARAELAALPLAPPGAEGQARVLGTGPDAKLHLHVTGLPPRPGYYEVWLIDPQTMQMTSLGHLGDRGDVLLPITSTTDLRKYRVVDVSAEEYDNVQTHSGRSLLRGQLTT